MEMILTPRRLTLPLLFLLDTTQQRHRPKTNEVDVSAFAAMAASLEAQTAAKKKESPVETADIEAEATADQGDAGENGDADDAIEAALAGTEDVADDAAEDGAAEDGAADATAEDHEAQGAEAADLPAPVCVMYHVDMCEPGFLLVSLHFSASQSGRPTINNAPPLPPPPRPHLHPPQRRHLSLPRATQSR
jgi:hypothetical protein